MKRLLPCRVLSVLLTLLLLAPLFPVSAAASGAADAITLTSAPPNVTAQAAIVIDQATGEVLWGRNIDVMRPPASMTKVMTAYIIYEEIEAGNLTLDTMITISQAASNLSRNDTRFLAAGSQHSVETLLRLIMLPSNNGACVAMADHIAGSEAAFVGRMNATAQRLGMDAHYENSHGQWANSKSARATAILVRDFIARFPDILRITNMNIFYFNGVRTQNTNWRLIAQPHIDGFKTGTTPAAGFCLSSTAHRDGRRVVAVTMASAGFYARPADAQALLNWGLDELERRAAAFENIRADLVASVSTVRRNTNFSVTAYLAYARGGAMAQGGGWTVNGETVATFGSFIPTWYQTFTLTHWIPADSELEYVEIGLFLDLTATLRREASLTIPVSTQAPALFRDISGHWAYDDIGEAVSRGLFSGVGDGLFAPNGDMTRAMFVTVLGRAARQLGLPVASEDLPPFTDVSSNAWYTNYVAWAFEQGIVQGIGANRFGTNNHITRQEVATLFYRFMQHYDLHLTGRPGDISDAFPDADQIADWAYDAIREAVRIGLITGFADGRLAPTHTATRAQLATMFLRFLNSAGDAASVPKLSAAGEVEALSEEAWTAQDDFAPTESDGNDPA